MSYTTLKVVIKAQRFDRFLAIVGNGMSTFSEPGAGSVSSSKALRPLSILQMDKYDNGTISIRAPNQPGVFLRLGYRFTDDHSWVWNGFGTVNCQYFKENVPYPDGKEIFRLRGHPDGSSSVKSVAHPGVYLRMDEEGIVDCQ